ncbi:MAG TPA: hypothetical protein VD995_03195 [Azospirillum sp.]|nr:hypothetical protein [Azospirillum sp.]
MDVSALPVIAELVHYPDAYDGPHGDALADVLSEVGSERWRQDLQWGGTSHDDAHIPADWYSFLYAQVDRLVDCTANAQPDFRHRLINIAALAVAAAQAWDRRHAPTAHPEEAAHG